MKKIIIALGAYVAGNVVSSVFNEKSGKTLKKDMKKGQEEGKEKSEVLVENFLKTQEKFLLAAKKFVLSTDEYQALVEHKEKVLSEAQKYIDEGKKAMSNVAGKTQSAQKKLEKTYEEYSNGAVKRFPKAGKKFLGNVKESLKEAFDEVRKG